jgi:16S rRNA (cytidine1402-2'-O)-methyltransferase
MTLSFDSKTAAARLMDAVAQQNFPASTLYVIATPIGNAADISLRALHALALADVVACEDTRKTGALLAHYGLSKSLVAAHQHNEREAAARLAERLQAGERVALVSDAGTPGISDPGARIVDVVLNAGLRVMPLPGASAAATALSAGGLLDDGFHFAGFLPAKSGQRDTVLQSLRGMRATLVFYEAPHRIQDTVAALARAFEPERQLVIARELTKLFEHIHRCKLADASQWLAGDTNRVRGEFVLLLQGAPAAAENDDAEAERVLSILLQELPVSQAAQLAARLTGMKKNSLYELALRLTK